MKTYKKGGKWVARYKAFYAFASSRKEASELLASHLFRTPRQTANSRTFFTH